MGKKDIFFSLILALFLAGALSLFASSWPDGLEKVAETKGFLEKGEGRPVFVSPVPDYAWPGMENEGLATAAAGIAGTLIVFGAGYGLAAFIRRRQNE
ncbi:MAG: PDGLE domain-containing protein [Candidatus Omnitrophica bacterium]|nr:PDGLE domain-containing protein [Candidatus Omnitrophota bacterium]